MRMLVPLSPRRVGMVVRVVMFMFMAHPGPLDGFSDESPRRKRGIVDF